tara:strand:+ start:561 stop:800 length:240 start_codon:yes stop_codon:yes gene_type:complete
MRKVILFSIVALAFASCEPIDSVGRVIVWELESGESVTDTIAPTTLLGEAQDLVDSFDNLSLDLSVNDAVLDTTWTFFL